MSTDKKIKILIADDHPIIRKGLRQIINDESDMQVTAEVSDGFEALDRLRKQKFDIAILDISMPKKTGLEILDELKLEKIKTRILILSVYSEEQYALRVIKTGAKGYLTKESAPDELVKAIRKIIEGETYISTIIADKVLSDLIVDNKKIHECLSNREYSVMLMIAKGMTLKEMSYQLNINVKTISTYRKRVMDKMKMNSNAQLILYCQENKLL
ncbi:MAG: response regulator transcription factor [Ignavibacteria bacterium]|nr:response regulator transcription factor [Ignavibacteria bacterium]